MAAEIRSGAGNKPRPVERQAEAARERNRAQGNPAPCCKPLELVQWLGRLILPPTIPGEPPPKLLCPYSGSGSEIVGALLAGWRDITAVEHSAQWVEVAKARADWWRKLLEAGAEPDVRKLLAEGDELQEVLAPTPGTITGPLFGDPPCS